MAIVFHLEDLTTAGPGSRSISYNTVNLARHAARAAESRPRVIATLDSLAPLLPGDDFIHGQRVGFRILDGDLGGASEVAAEGCRASAWWCDALRGFVRHELGDFLGAEHAFADALGEVPFPIACGWSDEIAVVLEGSLREDYESRACTDRAELESRIWWLADPFWMLPGNDRRTEHFARLVAWRLYFESIPPAWGVVSPGTYNPTNPIHDRARAMKVSQGWPAWWWSPEGVTWYGPTDLAGYSFLPRPSAVENPEASEAADWALSLKDDDLIGAIGDGLRDRWRALRGFDDWEDRYLPSYEVYADLPMQTALFARGDSSAVVAATELDRHPLIVRRPLTVGMALAHSEREPMHIAMGDSVGTRYVMRATVPAQPYVVSIEAFSDDGAARVRFGHRGLPARAEDEIGLSDVLLFDWTEGIPETLDAVAPRMLGTTRIGADTEVGLFWETYGIRENERLEVSVRVVPEDPGFWRSLGQTLRLVDEREAAAVTWDEGAAVEGTAARTLRLDLAGLSAGRYEIEVALRGEDGREATVRRAIERVEED